MESDVLSLEYEYYCYTQNYRVVVRMEKIMVCLLNPLMIMQVGLCVNKELAE